MKYRINRLSFIYDLTEVFIGNDEVVLFKSEVPIALVKHNQLYVSKGLTCTLSNYVLNKWENNGLSFPVFKHESFFKLTTAKN